MKRVSRHRISYLVNNLLTKSRRCLGNHNLMYISNFKYWKVNRNIMHRIIWEFLMVGTANIEGIKNNDLAEVINCSIMNDAIRFNDNHDYWITNKFIRFVNEYNNQLKKIISK